MYLQQQAVALLGTAVALFTPIASHPKQVDFEARNLATIKSVYNLTLYPNNLPVIQKGGAGVPPGLFSANATGRITPLGNFTGFEDSIEYFYGLAFTSQPPLYPIFSKMEIASFTSGCAEIASSVAYLTVTVNNPGAADHGKFLAKAKQVAFWRFDSEGAVLYYDAWIPNLQRFQNTWSGVDFADQNVQNASVAQLCPAIQQMCKGANAQYESVEACVDYIGHLPFGSFDEIWGNNYVCRSVHALLTAIRPDVHCPHVGPSGGMKCVEVPYNSYYFDDAELFSDYPEGDAFKCPEKKEQYTTGDKAELL